VNKPHVVATPFELLRLSDDRCQDSRIVGGKAATLARLYRQLPGMIPPGVAVPAGAASLLLEEDPSTSGSAYVKYLMDALENLSDSPHRTYAIRSSAMHEDAQGGSFAGQYSSSLGCRTVDDILQGIRKTIASGASSGVLAYGQRTGIPTSDLPSVLIQEMIIADRSGVAFTRNPVTGEREVVINASYGLGDAVVDGSITPDEIVCSDDGKVIESRIGRKQVMSLLTSGGITRIRVPTDLTNALSLSDDQVRAVAGAALRCEAILGYPVDTEWAITGQGIFVVQARPITRLLKPQGLRNAK
jgi:pyruvate,water dikinase